ncbi:bifunctional hydroxymethylpyrimidine kinase/phosphomethylpyrimidine kinase [Fodinibius sediminis]|uniref:hydroxymethylpyrimidine kinase n=1 Tax=Fodinibius sediminis TaxID=1214077 RepID=A0A521AIV9_9BACT|nr:bifunctional hydroxymethylpyrimidine kinase/phosphomethylpyrimidine kinase [Fodinibius sediminis]SMO34746.1 hydroxymethylpyrimidine/phosphomethylpyrimidine kinase [Fodinibius sediminis]
MSSSTEKRSYHRVLTIATSDSGGGAGIQADLKTFSAMGCYGMSALAALTAQNTHEVRGIHALPPEYVALQIDTVVEDLGVNAVKIGMLFNQRIMEAVADRLSFHDIERVVLDPVMVSQSGAKLIEDDAVEVLKHTLFPLSAMITPNLPEAETLLGIEIENRSKMEQAARSLLRFGSGSVLLKGGHFDDEQSLDCLVLQEPDEQGRDIYWYEAERVATDNTHGTGCTLSSAIASGLAKGKTWPEAVDNAKTYITGAIAAGSRYDIGKGGGPLHHFYQFWD